jgi:hypothetical protein
MEREPGRTRDNRPFCVLNDADERYPKPHAYARHENTVNVGPHRIHTGPGHPSRIVLPILLASDVRG